MRVRISISLDSETVQAIDNVGGPRSRFIEAAVKEKLYRLAEGSNLPIVLEDVNDELVDILLDHVQVDGNGELVGSSR